MIVLSLLYSMNQDGLRRIKSFVSVIILAYVFIAPLNVGVIIQLPYFASLTLIDSYLKIYGLNGSLSKFWP